MFVLPERTLTDEELLQIIDFYFKRDYSLMTSREDLPKEVLSVEEAVGENAVEQMKTMASHPISNRNRQSGNIFGS